VSAPPRAHHWPRHGDLRAPPGGGGGAPRAGLAAAGGVSHHRVSAATRTVATRERPKACLHKEMSVTTLAARAGILPAAWVGWASCFAVLHTFFLFTSAGVASTSAAT
jgi:hypothetical protein